MGNTVDRRAVLSTLWIFTLFNFLFRDIHELGRPGYLAEIMTGTVNGVLITDELLLLAGIALEIIILMVILARVLPYRVNRWANIIVGVFTIVTIVANGQNDLDDFFFAGVEIITSLIIIWYAWTWRRQEEIDLSVT